MVYPALSSVVSNVIIGCKLNKGMYLGIFMLTFEDIELIYRGEIKKKKVKKTNVKTKDEKMLEVLEYAAFHGDKAAGEHFKMTRSLIRNWRWKAKCRGII